jgi:sugar transferase (PEP-CTERM/EpsH1 system associated)
VKLLYLAHRIPYPPDKGDKIRSFHQVKYLGERHEVALLAFVDDPADLRHVDTLRRWCASVDVVCRSPRTARMLGLRGLLDSRSLSVAAFDSAELRRRARERAAGVDAIVAFSSVMAQYAPPESRAVRIADIVDIDSEKWRIYASRRPWPLSWIYALEADRLGQYEASVARTWDEALVVSEREASSLRQLATDARVTVLPNGVDVDYFAPAAPSDEPNLVFTGAMDYFPNVDGITAFCDEVFPRIRQAIPDARLCIVGRNPAREVVRLGDRPGITVTGTVPDVRPYVRAAAIAVAPLRIARGVQNKILEAMASGLPVVGSSTAVEGLDDSGESGVLSAANPAQFAEIVTAYLRDPASRHAAGARARAYVERHYRWEEHGLHLERIIADRAADRAARGSGAVR